MIEYVALLRGITPSNPNMRNEKLRGVLASLGFKNVRSVISSGNILFAGEDTNTARIEHDIEQALTDQLGINSAAIIRSKKQLEALVDQEPFAGYVHEPKSYLTVTFLQPGLQGNTRFKPDQIPQIICTDRQAGAICSVIDTTASKTPDVILLLEKQFGKAITTRTWNTVQRIYKKMDA